MDSLNQVVESRVIAASSLGSRPRSGAEGYGAGGEDAPLDDHHGGVFAVELLDKELGDAVGVEGLTAGEDVDGGETVLGPSVNTKVRLGDGHNAGNALGMELVEGLSEDLGPHLLGGGQEGFSNERQVVQEDAVTILQFQQ